MARLDELGSSRLAAEDSPEAVFQLMLDRGWSDGLPVIPPTADRVGRMLESAGREPSELIGYINPDGGAATVER